jgi:flavin reductase (DIM6/NTAB) family NADH-FMN oxidoreductase RutF
MDEREYRRVIGGFGTGVAVVTTRTADGPSGMTVNSLTSVSLDPPLLLVCLARGTRTAKAVEQAGAFVVNLLDHTQKAVANTFAAAGEDHFRDVELNPDADGLPVLCGGLGHLRCEVERIDEGGDHVIVLARVAEAVMGSGDPLLFYRGRYARHIAFEDYPTPNWWS